MEYITLRVRDSDNNGAVRQQVIQFHNAFLRKRDYHPSDEFLRHRIRILY